MLEQFTAWLGGLVKDFVAALEQMLKDVFIAITESVLDMVVYVVGLIPVPDVAQSGFQYLITPLPQGTLFILGQVGFAAGMAIIGSAYAARILRKLVTLFQW